MRTDFAGEPKEDPGNAGESALVGAGAFQDWSGGWKNRLVPTTGYAGCREGLSSSGEEAGEKSPQAPEKRANLSHEDDGQDDAESDLDGKFSHDALPKYRQAP